MTEIKPWNKKFDRSPGVHCHSTMDSLHLQLFIFTRLALQRWRKIDFPSVCLSLILQREIFHRFSGFVWAKVNWLSLIKNLFSFLKPTLLSEKSSEVGKTSRIGIYKKNKFPLKVVGGFKWHLMENSTTKA